uniref:Reverse transcriptase domain-containing protein n=1 Tax=Tanacetum cinerariifolium TaxID=118510 RepID=A0A6L2JJ10_TANCI|nr:reverse transcriptase domain-containing protein [Tanacetum cinerariifolium]
MSSSDIPFYSLSEGVKFSIPLVIQSDTEIEMNAEVPAVIPEISPKVEVIAVTFACWLVEARRWSFTRDSIDTWRHQEGEPKYEMEEGPLAQIHLITERIESDEPEIETLCTRAMWEEAHVAILRGLLRIVRIRTSDLEFRVEEAEFKLKTMPTTQSRLISVEIDQIVAQRVTDAIEAIVVYETKIRVARDSMNQVNVARVYTAGSNEKKAYAGNLPYCNKGFYSVHVSTDILRAYSWVVSIIGTVAYRLELPKQLRRVHSTFHMSNLKKCLSDETLVIPLDEIQIDNKLNFVEEPVKILNREAKRLKQSRIPIIKCDTMSSSNIPFYSLSKGVEFLIPLVILSDTEIEMNVEVPAVIPEISPKVERKVLLARIESDEQEIETLCTRAMWEEAHVAILRGLLRIIGVRTSDLEFRVEEAEFRLKQCERGWIQDGVRIRILEEHLAQRVTDAIEAIVVYETKIRVARDSMNQVNVARVYTAGSNEKKAYAGNLPYCNKGFYSVHVSTDILRAYSWVVSIIGSGIYSKINLGSSYHQLKVREEYISKTTLRTRYGYYKSHDYADWFDYTISIHEPRESVNAMSKKEKVKSLSVRSLVMTINPNLPTQIRDAQVETLQEENVKNELRHNWEIVIVRRNYAKMRRKPLEYQVADKVMLKVSPWKGLICFSKREKLNPRYIEHFKILAKVRTVAYQLELPEQLRRVHSTFHMSNLKKCLSDEELVIPLDGIQIDNKLNFVEEPVKILNREAKCLKQSCIPIIKSEQQQEEEAERCATKTISTGNV